MFEAIVPIADSRSLLSLLGPRDQHLRSIRDALGVTISARNGDLRISGPESAVTKATLLVRQLLERLQQRGTLDADEVTQALEEVSGGRKGPESQPIETMQAGRRIRPRTPGQTHYVECIRRHDIVFCVGPAGTGKTYLAVAMAVEALRQGQMRKIVLVRPAVEAGESLGFLPGDMQAKINPYLRPLMDALREMIDYDQMKRYTEQDLIEVIPLAYMRGRTLNEAFIILDEAQNTTVAQMKMFLTRMGHGSKIVVSGDITQTDLPPQTRSGLVDAMQRLRGIEGMAFVRMTAADIVRNPLVHQIVLAYDKEVP
jgi:phosphate starvation-inducible PhoH-like protein